MTDGGWLLYGAKTGNCLRAAIGLEEAGLPYEIRRVNLQFGEQRGPDFLALNPAGKVPVLVGRAAAVGGRFVLTQSNAILLFADIQAPGRLLPTSVKQRIQALERYFYFIADVVAPIIAGSYLKRSDVGAAAPLFAQSMDAIVRAERFVAYSEYMGGDAFSLADIAAYAIMITVRDELPWNQVPLLERWYARIGSRQGVQRGMSAFDYPGTR
ncbi:MAG: Glutathione S-transferase [Nevskia sp.]|nr:Glutathione S-transferase [Nevskia sp.]